MVEDVGSELPLVSIGVPVFNEERYLCATLDSLLAQTYSNIEIVISDNSSTDATPEICQRYAAKYQRIHYHSMEANRGPAANFNKVLELSNGSYFMWASGHDLWHEEFIERCVAVYGRQKKAVLVFGDANWIDDDGNKLDREYGWSDTRGLQVVARYVTVFWGHMNPILGLLKKENLPADIMLSMVGTDLVILSRLAIQGEFVFAQGASWSRRGFRMEQAYSEKLQRYKSSAYGLSGKSLLSRWFPLLQLPVELIKIVFRAQLGLLEKTILLLLLLVMFPFRYISGKFLQ